MDRITQTVGFRHIIKKIFLCLTTKDILSCRNVNTSFQNILNDPRSWINRLAFVGHNDMKTKWIEVMDHLKESTTIATKQKSKLLNCITNCLIKFHKEISILKDGGRFFESVTDVSIEAGYDNVFKNVTLVHIAARFDNVELLKFFRKLYSNEEFYSCNDLAIQPLHEAVIRGNIRSLKYLAEIQENVIAWDQVVLIAAAKGHMKMLKFAIDYLCGQRDFDINSFTMNSREQSTPINLATLNRQLRVLKYLIPFSKNPFKSNFYGNTPLHIAAENGYIEIVKYLLALNHTPNPRSSNGNTPMIFAAQFNHLNVLKTLIPISKNFLEEFNDEGWNVLHMSAFKGHLDIIKYIFKKCKNVPNIPNPISGTHAIDYAASYGYIEVVKYLAKRFPAPIIIPNVFGVNAIHKASENGHSKVVEFLFKFTSTPNDPVIGQPNDTPLNIAKRFNKFDVVEVIERLNRKSRPSRKRKRFD